MWQPTFLRWLFPQWNLYVSVKPGTSPWRCQVLIIRPHRKWTRDYVYLVTFITLILLTKCSLTAHLLHSFQFLQAGRWKKPEIMRSHPDTMECPNLKQVTLASGCTFTLVWICSIPLNSLLIILTYCAFIHVAECSWRVLFQMQCSWQLLFKGTSNVLQLLMNVQWSHQLLSTNSPVKEGTSIRQQYLLCRYKIRQLTPVEN